MSGKKDFFNIFLLSLSVVLFLYASIYFFISQINTKDIDQISFEIPVLLEKKNIEPISLLFVGDIMLDRTIRKDGESTTYSNLFSCLTEEFSKHDEVIGNLEGTITNFKSISRDASYESPESFRFTFDPEAVESLVSIGLSIVSLANNHIRDFGDEGIRQTIQNASTLNLTTFGNPQEGNQRYTIKNIKETRIAFIPYNQFFGTAEQTYTDLKQVETLSDIQIIFAHWGDEYVAAREDTKLLARSFVDKGADLIIGAHPHIIQENELYKNTPIYYSLGNFIFDQYWEESVRTGLALVVNITNKKNISITELFTESKRHQGTCFKNTPKP